MDVYDLVKILKRKSLPYESVSKNLHDELLYESRNSEYRLFSNLCYVAAGLGTSLEKEFDKNRNLMQRNKELEKRIEDLERERDTLLLDYQALREKMALYEKTIKELKTDKADRR